MSKRSLDNDIVQTPPQGPITHATPPIPVRCRVRWTIDLKYMPIENAWAVAWTRNQVCVYWFTRGMPNPTFAWLSAHDVQRLP